MDMAQVPRCGSLAQNPVHDMLAAAVANTDVAKNVVVNDMEPQQHAAVPIMILSPILKGAGHTTRKSHRCGKTCIITVKPYNRELEQKNTSNKAANDEPRPSMSGQAGSRLKSTKPRHIDQIDF